MNFSFVEKLHYLYADYCISVGIWVICLGDTINTGK